MDDNAPYAEFADWLRTLAAQAGYDPDARGGTSSLAKAADVDRGQLSRALAGSVQPSIQTQRGIVRALREKGIRVGLSEMLVRSKVLKADDIPAPGEPPPPPIGDIDLREVARRYGIPPGERTELFVKSVESVAITFAHGQDSTTISKPQTGGP